MATRQRGRTEQAVLFCAGKRSATICLANIATICLIAHATTCLSPHRRPVASCRKGKRGKPMESQQPKKPSKQVTEARAAAQRAKLDAQAESRRLEAET